LHNERFSNLYHSLSVVRVSKLRRMRGTGHVARIGEMRKACKISVWIPEEKTPLGKSRRKWDVAGPEAVD